MFPLHIGADPIGAIEYFDGILDEMEIYSRRLSPVELGTIRNADSRGKCKYIDEFDILGPAMGGAALRVTVSGKLIEIMTTPGDSSTRLAMDSVSAINADPTLQQRGVTATSRGAHVSCLRTRRWRCSGARILGSS